MRTEICIPAKQFYVTIMNGLHFFFLPEIQCLAYGPRLRLKIEKVKLSLNFLLKVRKLFTEKLRNHKEKKPARNFKVSPNKKDGMMGKGILQRFFSFLIFLYFLWKC